jgi:uncharacterized phage protein gp47/JayE
MPDILDDTGLELKRLNEIKDDLETAFRNIYGQDINLDQNTPDGQLIGILSQACIDLRELLQGIYNSFDPDKAIGTTLDARVAINGLIRKGGTYTYVPITIIADRVLSLSGLDTVSADEAFCISDNQGTLFVLQQGIVFNQPGEIIASFRAKEIGAIEILPNTITTAISIVLGIVSINNPSTASVKGSNEETDAQLRVRRQKSFALASAGYPYSLISALLALTDVGYVRVYENLTNNTDIDAIAPHSIWVIVEGGNNTEIAQAIYENRTAGSGMKGSISVDIVQVDGTIFTVQFDTTITQPLYIELTLSTTAGVIDIEYLKNELIKRLVLDIYSSIDATDLIVQTKEIYPKALVTLSKVSRDGLTWQDYVFPTVKNARFILNPDNINITVE